MKNTSKFSKICNEIHECLKNTWRRFGNLKEYSKISGGYSKTCINIEKSLRATQRMPPSFHSASVFRTSCNHWAPHLLSTVAPNGWRMFNNMGALWGEGGILWAAPHDWRMSNSMGALGEKLAFASWRPMIEHECFSRTWECHADKGCNTWTHASRDALPVPCQNQVCSVSFVLRK